MRRLWVWAALAALLLLVGCRTGQAVTVDSDALTPSDCGSVHVQRLITFCASPQAADLAARNAELMGSGPREGGDIPYSPVPIGDSPVRGPDSAPVTIVMFSDLECPYCRELHHTLAALQKESPADVRVVFKHTPLTFHPHAVPAALGALAAREQGKFWEYVDRIYGSDEELTDESLLATAAALGLDLEQFRNDFGSAPHIAALESDLDLASQAGVEGTPTMFVNGVRVVGVYPIEDLRALVKSQKELVARLKDAGVPQNDLYWRLVAVQYQPAPPSHPDGDAPDEGPMPDVVAMVPVADAPVRGAAADDALVTIVEFSDFQCPYCAAAVDVVKDLLAGGAGDTRLAFKHFPLGGHPQAGPAAVASVVAQSKGKFWEFHDLLFANQRDLSPEGLAAQGEKVGLKPEVVTAALDNSELQARVMADQKLGLDLGVQGTPTFFINGVMMMGIESPEAFAQIVAEQRELARKVQEETGLKGDALYEAVVKRNQAARAAP